MVRKVSDGEIKEAMFSLGDNKAPGPDGYTAAFLKKHGTLSLLTCKRGLRQGDPISLYLFTLVMEVFTLMLNRRAHQSASFTFHRYCSCLNIINLCFADGLFLFSHGDVDSARVIMKALEDFKNPLGLTPSLPKSTAYFCNVLNYVKISILGILPFEEGTLPVKHLGVPLVPSRLVYHDCSELMEKIKRHINDWKNKSLSFMGRAQLIRSVLGSMHLYWASVFILPSRLMLELEHAMRWLLWCQGEFKRGKAKVAWDAVCFPKREGGLGIRSNGYTYTSLMGTRFGIFHLEETCHGVGERFCSIVSNRDIYRHGFHLDSKVAAIIDQEAYEKLHWKDLDNLDGDFSVAKAWECIRPRNNMVEWYHVVWFSNQIPRHAVNLWLVIKRKLKTQDTLRQCDVSNGTNLNLLQCPLCESQPNSHDHLFFACWFSTKVWDHLKTFACIPNVPTDLQPILDFIIPLAKKKSARCVILKLIFAASCYFIWQERNARLFKKMKRTHDQIIEAIKNTVRLKLLSCSFKKTLNIQTLFHVWKLPNSLMRLAH
ncbi:reverse transcriptase domain, reverse transcriptase zinc-binding domain protein [Tanacetum coccineum]